VKPSGTLLYSFLCFGSWAMINWMIMKDYGKIIKNLAVMIINYPGICLDGLRKTMKISILLNVKPSQFEPPNLNRQLQEMF
jgi:hypothetical protein